MLSVILAAAGLFAGSAQAVNVPLPPAPNFKARSYVLVDYRSGQVVAEREADMPVEPASLTKLMTAYIAFSELKNGNISPDDAVTVSEKAWRAPGSRMFIEVGSTVSVEELLRGIIIQSGNDASIALAEHIAGDEGTFASWMNQYAKRLGMKNTRFTNATGLPGEGLLSSARDLAELTRALIRDFPEYYPLYAERVYTYNGITQYNRNKLLWRDDSVDGVKTGHTESAGFCLVSSAEREGMRLISVVIGTESENARARASQALLNYGFRFYESHELLAAGDTVTTVYPWKGGIEALRVGTREPVFVTIARGRADDVTISTRLPEQVMAPVENGQLLGSATISVGDKAVRDIPLYALEPAPLGSLWQRLYDEARLFLER